MKPIYLEIQAFGPYVEKQTVDFEKLGEKGIFLIKGNTGSGKTTIFDAMTFALYGGSSGTDEKTKNGRNDLEEWRCTQAPAELDTYVSFVFSVNGHRYRFMRGLAKKRINFSATYECGEFDEDGNVIPFFNNPKDDLLTKKAEELVGLTKEQFRQVVLLPQGQFEKFLTAKSDDKEAILQKIFASAQWSKYAAAFFDSCLARKSELEEIRTGIIRSLSEEDLSSLEKLQEFISSQNEAVADLSKSHNDFDGAKKQKQLQDDIKLSEKFAPLHKLEDERDSLTAKKELIDSKRLKYDEAEKAEALRKPIDEYETAVSEEQKRCKTFDSLLSQLPAAEKSKAEAEERKKKHDAESPVEKLTGQIAVFEGKREVYKSIEGLRKAFKDAEEKQKTAEAQYAKAEKNYSDAVSDAKSGKDNYDNAAASAKAYRDKYFAGIYGEIAAELKENEKCPVCGSTAHPFPAVKLADSVSKNDCDAKEKIAERAKAKWDAFETARASCEIAKNEAYKLLNECKLAFNDAKTKLSEAEKGLIASVPDLNALEKEIEKANNKIAEYKDAGKAVQDALDAAIKEITSLKEKIATAGEEKKAAEKKASDMLLLLEKELKKSGYKKFEDAKAKLLSEKDRTDMHTEIVEYETSVKHNADELKATQAALKGKKEPDKSLFKARQAEITAESEKFNRESAALKTSVERLSKKLAELTKKQEYYNENISEAESDLAFAKKLRGDAGIGIQRYVLAIMFNQVIGEANRMLEKVHGGRYRLFRSDDKGQGNKRGLELKVLDSRSPENKDGRSVAMLSGGEKFLVSLALSIGMSTVAQKSGVRIEALFIDEGFGTLDDSSIQDAMEVLDSVRKGTGTIGIISHVQLLEANIPVHLNVIKTEAGSKIKVE